MVDYRPTDLDRFGYSFTEGQRIVRQAALDFARGRLAAGTMERDRSRRYPIEIVPELGELGFLAMRVPLEWGGSGVDATGFALVLEAISETEASFGAILASSNLVASLLGAYGTDSQRRRWLPRLAAGELGPGAFCLTEPHTGSDAGAIETHARAAGDDFVLDGSKMWITNGSHAGLFLVFAKTDPDRGSRGISTFIVERETRGLIIGADEPKMGMRCTGTVALYFEECRIPADNLLGPINRGYSMALEALSPGRAGIAAQALGIGEAAFREGLAYGGERRAFGQRLVDFQNSKFRLADCRTQLDAAWLLTLRATRLMDRGTDAVMEASMAKVAASEVCGRVVDAMLQLHGGYGYSEQYSVERLYRDARVTRIYEGSNEIQRLIIARHLLRSLGA